MTRFVVEEIKLHGGHFTGVHCQTLDLCHPLLCEAACCDEVRLQCLQPRAFRSRRFRIQISLDYQQRRNILRCQFAQRRYAYAIEDVAESVGRIW